MRMTHAINSIYKLVCFLIIFHTTGSDNAFVVEAFQTLLLITVVNTDSYHVQAR